MFDNPIVGELSMKRYLAILIMVMPVVLSGCAGCNTAGHGYDNSYTVGPSGQIVPTNIDGGGSGVPPQSGRH